MIRLSDTNPTKQLWTWEYDAEKGAFEVKETLYKQYWIDRRSVTDIAEEKECSRQTISNRLAKTSIKTYPDVIYKPKGIDRWSFEYDIFPLFEGERAYSSDELVWDAVSEVGPFEVAYLLTRTSKEAEWVFGGTASPEDVLWEHYPYEVAPDQLGDLVEQKRGKMWAAAKFYVARNWTDVLSKDPIPGWVFSRAMDALGLTQSEFADIVGFAPRSVRKWTTRTGKSGKLCTGENRQKVCRQLSNYFDERPGLDIK